VVAVLAIGAGASGCARHPAVSAEGLALRRVVIYRNGVGYFERAGHIQADRVYFKVKGSEVGDFLATLAVIEKGGSSVRSASFPIKTAQEIGANDCVRTRSIRARLDSVLAHGIYPIARIVVAKDPRLAAHKPQWSVQARDGGQWRDRINIAWVDAYNDSVWV